jgi:hypothetical protein
MSEYARLIGLLLLELMQLVFVLYSRLEFIGNVVGVVVGHSKYYCAFVTTSCNSSGCGAYYTCD